MNMSSTWTVNLIAAGHFQRSMARPVFHRTHGRHLRDMKNRTKARTSLFTFQGVRAIPSATQSLLVFIDS